MNLSSGTDADDDRVAALEQQNRLLAEQLQHYRDAQLQYQQRFAVMSTAAYWGLALSSSEFVGPVQSPEERQRHEADWACRQEEARQSTARALALLEEHIGREAMAAIQNGGAYPVRSKLWDEVIYLVPRDPHERIKILQKGSVVTESCLVSDPALSWPDVMLHRIRAVEVDESVVFNTGVIHDRRSRELVGSMWTRFRRVMGF